MEIVTDIHNNASNNLQVKSQFILAFRDSSLTTSGDEPQAASANATTPAPDRENNNNNRQKGKKRGQNKKRPRDEREDPSLKVCTAVLNPGGTCVYGDKCIFSHDLVSFLKTMRPEDIQPTCHIHSTYGYCQFGINCRSGLSHIDRKTGLNMKQVNVDDFKPLPKTLNFLRGEVAKQIRKGTYPFVCPRKQAGDNNSAPSAKSPVPSSSSSSAIPDSAYSADNNGENRKGKKKASTSSSSTSTPTPTPTSTTTSTSTTNNDSWQGVVDLSALPSKSVKMVDFENKIYVAPLTTVGNLPFRRIMKHFGADITCGEMAMCANLLQGQGSEWALLKRHPSEDVFGVQLAGGFPDQLIRCAELLEAECSVDFVDINCGCPLDLVCDKGAGAAMMNHKRRLGDAVEGMSKVLSCPVTIKMRTGWDEKKPFAKDLVHNIFSWQMSNIAAIMVHGRSRLQRYSKLANWDYIGDVGSMRLQTMENSPPSTFSSTFSSTSTSINSVVNTYTPPLIGNGDIFSYTDYEEKMRAGVSRTAMLARGALIKPWLPTEIKEQRHWDISATERLDMLKDFVHFGMEHWGSDQRGINTIRRFLLEWISFLHR